MNQPEQYFDQPERSSSEAPTQMSPISTRLISFHLHSGRTAGKQFLLNRKWHLHQVSDKLKKKKKKDYAINLTTCKAHLFSLQAP